MLNIEIINKNIALQDIKNLTIENLGHLGKRVVALIKSSALILQEKPAAAAFALFSISYVLLLTVDKVVRYINIENKGQLFISVVIASSLAAWIGGSLAFCYLAQLPLRAFEVAAIISVSGFVAHAILS